MSTVKKTEETKQIEKNIFFCKVIVLLLILMKNAF